MNDCGGLRERALLSLKGRGSAERISMSMPLELVLVRHGESVGNAAIHDAKAGRPTPPAASQHSSRLWVLNSIGEAQAEATGAWLRDHGLGSFDRYYCSPYVRAMQTAALLGLPDAAWWLEPLLRERDRGYEYVAGKDELASVFPHSARARHDDPFLWRPTAGESIPDVDLRLRGLLATLARELPDRRVLCVTHEDAMDALRFRLEKMTIDEWIDHNVHSVEPIPNCGVLHYTRRDPRDPAQVLPKFGWVRLVNPGNGGGFDWRPIVRRKFTNAELRKMVAERGTQVSGP